MMYHRQIPTGGKIHTREYRFVKKSISHATPGCVAGANKSQTTYENIHHSSWFISCFVSWNIPVLFFLGNYYLNKTKP